MKDSNIVLARPVKQRIKIRMQQLAKGIKTSLGTVKQQSSLDSSINQLNLLSAVQREYLFLIQLQYDSVTKTKTKKMRKNEISKRNFR